MLYLKGILLIITVFAVFRFAYTCYQAKVNNFGSLTIFVELGRNSKYS